MLATLLATLLATRLVVVDFAAAGLASATAAIGFASTAPLAPLPLVTVDTFPMSKESAHHVREGQFFDREKT